MTQRVLFIESDAALRAAVRPLLEAEGLSVDEADNGLAGIRRALASPPDLVVADVRLPDIDGCEVATRLKAEKGFAGVPFLVVGDSSAQHDLALAAGCDAFFARPDEAESCRAGGGPSWRASASAPPRRASAPASRCIRPPWPAGSSTHWPRCK